MSRKKKEISDIRVVATSVFVSLFDVSLNLIVALVTGSTVMLSQALQGLSDLITGGILYMGVRRSKKQADQEYQFGYGREVFFWVLVAGILMFCGTGLASLYVGFNQLAHPEHVENVWLAFVMLLVGLTTNYYAFSLSLKRIKQEGGKRQWWKYLVDSSIVETKATFVIDLLGTTAPILGLGALLAYIITGDARYDGIGSIVIGLSMMIAALLLILDVRDLIVGKAVDKDVTRKIIRATHSVGGVNKVLDIRTMYLGSAKLLVVIEVHMQDGLDTDEIEEITDKIKATVQKNVPLVHHIQVEVETPEGE